MALPSISITVGNGGLGLVLPSADGVVGLVMNGVATANLAIGVAKQIFSLEEAVALGLTTAYDSTNAVKVYEHIKRFYDVAGKGSELWVMLVSQAVNLATMCDVGNVYAKKLLDDAQGTIKVLGVVRNPASGYVGTISSGLDVDVYAAITNAHNLGAAYAALFQPVRILLDGYSYNNVAANLNDLTTYTNNRVGVLIGGVATGHNSMGLLLGKVAKIQVQRNIGRVKDGALPISTAFIGNSKPTFAISTALHNKGYITLTSHLRRAGYYFNDDRMAALPTDDFCFLANGRTLDKVISIAYDTYVNELLDNVDLDTNGKISVGQAKEFEGIIENAINTLMTAEGEISGVDAFVDHNQDVQATGKVCVQLRVQPLGTLREICVDLGFKANLS